MEPLGAILLGISLLGAQPDDYSPDYRFHSLYPLSKGIYATALPWQSDAMEYAKNFHIAEIGDFADLSQKELEGFEKKIAYVWLAGFYRSQIESDPFAKWAYLHKERTTLNPHYTPRGDDFYYDLCDEEVRKRRVEYLAERTRTLGLDGIFFDWANEEFLKEPGFEPLRKELERRYPGTPYRSCIGAFLRSLQARGLLIVTNQAYRNPSLLRYVHYDMSESYITTQTALTRLASIDGESRSIPVTTYVPVDEVLHYFRLLQKLKEEYEPFGFENFIYLNYCAPKLLPTPEGYRSAQPKEAIFYAYAMAKMAGFIPYTEVPYDHALERLKLYFAELGEPRQEMQRSDGFLFRLFENGFVLVATNLDRTSYLRVQNLPKGHYYDLFDEVWLKSDGSLVVKLEPYYDPFTRQSHPVAKVFIHEDTISRQR